MSAADMLTAENLAVLYDLKPSVITKNLGFLQRNRLKQ